ncbi:MAG: class SAM-dependent methyltransferase [Candidatus Solibacter sp.]|nr:class SAM-dependent methyltransferase [Candidatus Solibacter sp.]
MPDKNNRIGIARWRAVQRLELDFWSRWTTLLPYRDLDLPKYWREEVAQFGTTWERFRGLRVLDVGCGPVGLIHYIEDAAERIRIDPLLPQYDQKLPLQGPQLSISAVAESLPLAARSIDLAICFNALDHMFDPEAALDEIARVLRAGGTALFMIHTFPPWLRPLFWMDRIHPYHYTAEAFAATVSRRFRIEERKTVRRHFDVPPRNWLTPSCWKYLAAGMVLASTYIRASHAD